MLRSLTRLEAYGKERPAFWKKAGRGIVVYERRYRGFISPAFFVNRLPGKKENGLRRRICSESRAFAP